MKEDSILEAFARQLAYRVGCANLAKDVAVFWNARLRTTAGLACYRRRAIFLNPKLIEIAPDEVHRTLRHELAHLVAQERVGRHRIAPHGEEWRQACCDLDIPEELRCHDLPFKRTRMRRRYLYQCKECGRQMARVHRVRRRIACLACCRKFNAGKYHERFRFIEITSTSSVV